MTASVLLWIAYIIFFIEASPCINNQHCSDCDITTGHCLTECDTGYFDQKCASVCSKNCKNNTCILLLNGDSGCTNGCVLGYQGVSCNTPCHKPGDTCITCPGGCDGGYCQRGSSCVSGCVNSSYGTGCPEQSAGPCKDNQHCSICDIKTGHCLTECDTGYFDQNCSSVCSGNCKNKTCTVSNTGTGNCTDGCVPGYQGIGCNIPSGPCKNNQHCSICDNTTGHCLTECATGYFDQNCSSVCSGNCKNKTCIVSNTGAGNCTDGCVPGYRGIDCNIPYESMTYLRIGLLASSLFTVFCVLVTIITFFIKYLNKKRSQEYITPTQDMQVSPEAVGAPVYDEVDEAKMYDALTDEGQQASGAGYVELRSDARV